MDQDLLNDLLDEAATLYKADDSLNAVVKDAFIEQRKFIDDPAKLKALFCTRRAAKSYTAGLYMVETALKYPRSNSLFVGLTRQSAFDIIDKDILQVINRKHELGIDLNKALFNYTFPNGSVIRVTGVDVSEDEMNKLLGKKYKLTCIDEGSMYTVNTRHLIYDILGPAMADEEGTTCFLGTASNFTKGLFFDITNNKEPGWSIHRWSAHQNPHINWQKQLDQILENRPLYMETPQFRQWYLNEWVIETDKLVYKFNPDRNMFREWPYPASSKGWTFNLGVDTGWEDDNGFVLQGYHAGDPTLYVFKSFKKNHMYFDHPEKEKSVRKTIKEFMNERPIWRVVIDGANKQGVETMNIMQDIPFEYADKLGKVDHIEICNGELLEGKIKIHESCTDLIDEMMGLVWRTSGDKIVYPKKEHPSLPNHLCDAFLYGWYYGFHFLETPAKKAAIPGTPEYIKEQEDLHKQAIMERMQRENAQNNANGMPWVPSQNGINPWNQWD